jgi:hypothetical protein
VPANRNANRQKPQYRPGIWILWLEENTAIEKMNVPFSSAKPFRFIVPMNRWLV